MAVVRCAVLRAERPYAVRMAALRFAVRTARPRCVDRMAVLRFVARMAGQPMSAVYRPWVGAPYYGAVVAGVTIGTLVAATAPPPAPSPELCWFWSSPAQNQGYWDYCS